VTAEEEGFDAVVIDTMSDSGMAPLRSVLSIPVIGPGKASMLYALTLGSKFSVLAQWKPALPRYRKVIREYGFEAQCASVRSFDVEPDFINLTEGKEDATFPRMLETGLTHSRKAYAQPTERKDALVHALVDGALSV
jgi:allantoin racemase